MLELVASMWLNVFNANAKENAMKEQQNNANRRLQAGTPVVSTIDGELGRVVRVCTYRRNGIDAWSYLVKTSAGTEIWEAGELFVPTHEQA